MYIYGNALYMYTQCTPVHIPLSKCYMHVHVSTWYECGSIAQIKSTTISYSYMAGISLVLALRANTRLMPAI